MWRALLERRDHRETQRMLQESQLSVSGLLLRVGAYRRCPQLPATGTPSTASAESGCWSPQLVRTFPDADLELIKQVWDRNADQVRFDGSFRSVVPSLCLVVLLTYAPCDCALRSVKSTASTR